MSIFRDSKAREMAKRAQAKVDLLHNRLAEAGVAIPGDEKLLWFSAPDITGRICSLFERIGALTAKVDLLAEANSMKFVDVPAKPGHLALISTFPQAGSSEKSSAKK